MPDALAYILFLLGIPILWKSADWLVQGGAGLAQRLGVSPFVVGLTVVSFGTSAPEFFVNVYAAYQGSTALALGAVLGSNVANVLLILGLAAIVAGVEVTSNTLRLEIPFTALTTGVVSVLLFDEWFHSGSASVLASADGIILLAFFAIFLTYVYHLPRSRPSPVARAADIGSGRAVLLVLVGLAGLALGADWLVRGAQTLASTFGLQTGFVGFAVVAVGTSLPELAATVAAARMGRTDLAVGNVVGSNIFNVLWILGITAVVRPIPLSGDAGLQIGAAFAANLILLFFLGQDRRLNRGQGIVMAAGYILWLGWLGTRAT